LLLDRSIFDELRGADPGTGAKSVVRAHASSAGDIDIADEGAFTDIDTADDYKRAMLSGLTTDPADRGPRRKES
jgi:CTP:molybdopterin cytidylyltransferase MocA